jgi:hypothetical protein
MSTATVRLTSSTAIEFDSLSGEIGTAGVLLTLSGYAPNTPYNVIVIPLERVRAVIATLELTAKQAGLE